MFDRTTMSDVAILLVSTVCLIVCGPSRIPVQKAQPQQEDEKGTQPQEYPLGKKPETHPPEGVGTRVAPAEVREPEAKYVTAGSEAPGNFHIKEVTVSQERSELVSNGVRRVLAAELNPSISTEDLIFFGPKLAAAVGPNHEAEPFEQGIRFRSKDGSTEWVLAPGEVFAPSVSAAKDRELRVLYDGFEDRYVIIGLQGVSDESDSALSRLQVAVSDDGSPGGGWYSAALALDGATRTPYDACRFHGFAVDAESLYILLELGAVDEVRESLGVSVWVIDKGLKTAGFYSGGQVHFWVHTK